MQQLKCYKNVRDPKVELFRNFFLLWELEIFSFFGKRNFFSRFFVNLKSEWSQYDVSKVCKNKAKTVHKLCRLKIGDFWPPPTTLLFFVKLLWPSERSGSSDRTFKGQLISKTNCQADDSSKKRTNEFVFTKGQIISKAFFVFLTSPKKTNKRMKKFDLILLWYNKSNLFRSFFWRI